MLEAHLVESNRVRIGARAGIPLDLVALEGRAAPGGAELPGVFGPVAGLFGTLQAAQAIRLLTGGTGCPTGILTMFDMVDAQWHRVPIRKRDGCPSCGAARSETG